MSQDEADLEFTAALLAARITAARRESSTDSGESRGVVFLLGAGCSRQYGLPRFRDLLAAIWEDVFQESPSSTWTIEVLRDRLDRYWMTIGPRDRQEVVKHYLRYGQVHGQHCLGYRRLAQMAKLGGVRAFVNLNFDRLLEEALETEGVPFVVSFDFRQRPAGSLVVYKPFGSIERLERIADSSAPNDLILDIAQSDVVANPSEQPMVHDLLGQSDVVAIGYSGADARVAMALRSVENPKTHKLFVINHTSIDPRLAFVVTERASNHLVVRTDFESFMERLRRALSTEPGAPSPRGLEEEAIWTPEEREALKACLRLAYGLQAISGANDLHSEGIETHGERAFGRAVELASSCGLALTRPERFLLQAAGYLHDAGCFLACKARNDSPNLEGWRHHGRLTAERISDQLRRTPRLREKVIPATYEEQHREFVQERLLKLCSLHASIGEADNKLQDGMIRMNGIEIPLRFSILPPLLALADQIECDHPFLPWSDPVLQKGVPAELLDGESPYIHLRRRGDVQFEILTRRLLVKQAEPEHAPSARNLWQVSIVGLFLQELDVVSRRYGGWGIEMILDAAGEIPGKDQLAETFLAALHEPAGSDEPDQEPTLVDHGLTKAFISYSWDSSEHFAWVEELATRLGMDGIHVRLDQWDLAPGDLLTEYMLRAIRESDYVLIVCTPNYRARSDGRIGGVGREGMIMTADIFVPGNARKYIPLLREGESASAMPLWLYDRIYINFHKGSPESEGYVRLRDILLGRLPKAPSLGGPPIASP